MNNIFNNENYYPYGTSFGSAYPTQPAPQPMYTQPLTKEEQNELQKKSVPFTTQIDRLDLLRSYCTHRSGKDTALMQNQDGSFTCSICGATMTLDDYTEHEVTEISEKFNNVINNIKVKFYDIPVDIVKEICQIMPYVERMPKLFKLANDNFGRYAGYNPNINPAYASPNYPIWSSFNTLVGGYGVPMYGGPAQMPPQMMNQPTYGYPDPNMQYGYAQPMSTMGMQQNQMVAGGNPLYAQPAPAPQQMAPQQVSAPAPQQNPNAQPVPNNDNTVTTTATVSL